MLGHGAGALGLAAVAAALAGCAPQHPAPSACLLDAFTVKTVTGGHDVAAVPSADGTRCDYLFVDADAGKVSDVQIDHDPASPPAADGRAHAASGFVADGVIWRVEVSAAPSVDQESLARPLAALVRIAESELGVPAPDPSAGPGGLF